MLLENQINKFSRNLLSNMMKISSDSRLVKKGDIFVSIKGNRFDGNKFIEDAIAKGSKIIIHSGKIKKKNKKVTYIRLKDTREALARISSNYYKKKPHNIIAVTGTNGKTSVSDFFHQIFLLENKKVGVLGTLGFKKNKSLKKRDLTTLDPLNLHKDLNEMKRNGINNAIIEASSHGLNQKRLNFLNLKAGIFTNLSQDHLDYHKNMQNYFNSKLILFKKLLRKNSYLISDTDIEQYKTLEKIGKKRGLKVYSIGKRGNVFQVIKHKIFKNFQVLEIRYNKKIYKLKINLYGSIQIKNLFLAILAAKICGLKIKKIFKKIDKIKSIDGRLELVRKLSNKSKIFLDYAHTPDALENAILSLKEHFNKKITVVFGCGGDRDKSKRKLMGLVAKKFCNKIYVTDDNPRNENPKNIRKHILRGLIGSNAKEIPNRKKAIEYAIKNSSPYEIILIAGKGHELYQELSGKKYFFSDKEIIKKYKNRILKSKKNNFYYNSDILKRIVNSKKNYFFDGVSINSKKIKNKNLFVAIKGKKNDGHNYLDEANKNGASYCIVSKKNERKKNCIKVKNTMKFLKDLALGNRDSSSAKIIAVTGSSGKTSVKSILGSVLKKYSNTYFSPESFNNHYGVPLSLSNIKPSDEYGVFEIGMNRPNEIFRLSSLVKPHIGIITNISEAHLENFKNIKGIAKAKSEIIYNIKKGGTIILNRDDKFFSYFKKIALKNNVKVISFGYSKKSGTKFLNIVKKNKRFCLTLSVDNKKFLVDINSNSSTYIMNILCCIATLSELGLDLQKIGNFFTSSKLLYGRGKITKVKKFNKRFFLVDESYNANPLSVRSAIENFSKIKKNRKRKYFLFGDMLELGRNSQIYHKKISKFINRSDIDKIFVYGKKSEETYKHIKKSKKGEIIKNFEAFNAAISKILKNGDFLMIKGSNATKLHKISKNYLGGN